MLIQCERLWLFETEINDPFFLGTKDGVTATLAADNPRIITQLDLVTVVFFMDTITKAGVNYTTKYGGEDNEISDSYGKSLQDYQLEFNVPTLPGKQKQIEQLIGKQFSLLAMRRDLSHFVIFAQFQADDFTIDNEVQQRIVMKAGNTNARIFNVQSFDIENILDIITEEGVEGGFDYGFDFQLD